MSDKKIENHKKSFEIRGYQSGDEMAICALFEKVFGKPMGKTESIRHWRWEFLENPADGLFVQLAWDGDKLVGQYTASPVYMYADGRNITAALSHDTMTDPEYARLGIFRNTAEALYADQKKEGHFFIYGFPNRNSIHGFIKHLQWQRIMTVPVHVRPIRMIKNISRYLSAGMRVSQKEESILNVASLPYDKSGVYNLRIEKEFGNWADELWKSCRNQHRLWVVRDRNYLNWRYVLKPENQYNIVSAWEDDKPIGYVVFAFIDMNFGKSVFVMDFVTDLNYKGAAELLLSSVINAAHENACAVASVLLTPGSKYLHIFRKKLFLPLPEYIFPQPLYFGARSFDSSFNHLIFNPKAWSISWGDNDVI